MRLQDKVAIVTGAGSGIGRAVAVRFAQEGARVVVDDVNREGGEATVARIREAGGEACFVAADVSRAEEVNQLVATAADTYGGLHVLVNNAICAGKAVLDNEWEPIVEVSFRGTWLCSQAAIPAMTRAGGGSIVNISSVNGLMGFSTEHVYSGVKAGILGMSRSLACEVGRSGIRVNCICPGTIVTEIWQPQIDADPELLDRLARLYPIGRLGKPEDIAHAALYLASDEASFVTGAVFVIDGGITAGNLAFEV
jgi:NAD(P)-dependent dehydrogenase (short-subunit alcohol dehydrogenase family)